VAVDIKRNEPSLLQMLPVVVVIVAVAYYGVIALNTGDALWFRSEFSAVPVRMIVYCYGEDQPVNPIDADFEPLNNLVNVALSGDKRWDPRSMSDVTYEDYRTHPRMVALELRYSPAVRVHSRYKFFSRVDTLIFPLEGRHAEYNPVFGRHIDEMVPGMFQLGDSAPIRDYLRTQGLCP
jgi:hypothetical protein